MQSIYLTGKDIQLLTGYSEDAAIRHRRAILDALGKTERQAKLTVWDYARYHKISFCEFYEHLILSRGGKPKKAA